jgi:hypothetical protein
VIKQPLSKDEIRNLIKLLREVFKYFQTLRNSSELAKEIQFPKIPPKLSESLIWHLISEGKLLEVAHRQVKLGGKIADIIVTDKSENEFRIEVKATATKKFQYLGPKDINCDYLIWVSFGDYFLQDSARFIQIFVLKEPKKFFSSPRKISLKYFVEIAGNGIQLFDFDLSSF